MDKPVLIIM